MITLTFEYYSSNSESVSILDSEDVTQLKATPQKISCLDLMPIMRPVSPSTEKHNAETILMNKSTEQK